MKVKAIVSTKYVTESLELRLPDYIDVPQIDAIELVRNSPELLEALELMLKYEGDRETNGIGLEFDTEELEDAKSKANAIIKKIKIG